MTIEEIGVEELKAKKKIEQAKKIADVIVDNAKRRADEILK